MKINLPKKVRAGIYIATGVLAPVAGYLLAIGVIGEKEMALWMAEVTFAAALAGLNLSNDGEN